MLTFAASDAELLLVISLITMVFWMVVGWRAMRAHEKIAESHEALAKAAGAFTARYAQPTAEEVRARRDAMRGPIPPPRAEPPPGGDAF